MIKRLIPLSIVVVVCIAGCAAREMEKQVSPAAPFGNDPVYFITPQDHDTVTSPVTVRFGLQRMGVAPAGVDRPQSGHHHLLIDMHEPLSMQQPIPRTEHHLHFGDGQTEATIELSPGQHTLQLLLGDYNHIPHQPPVISKQITITVTEPKYPEQKGVYFITPQDHDTVSSPVTVRFGLKGMGVAPAGADRPQSGHHHLLIDVQEPLSMQQPIPRTERHLHFGDGQTEAAIELSPGQHTLQLLLGDHNHFPHQPPVISEKITVFVR